MNNDYIQEVVIAVVLVFLLIFFIDPFMYWMPGMFTMAVTGGLVVAFGIFAVFLWREKPRDEREGLHRMMADRAAFLAGSGILVLGIVTQTLRHEKADWLVVTLGVMVAAKIIGLMWARMRS